MLKALTGSVTLDKMEVKDDLHKACAVYGAEYAVFEIEKAGRYIFQSV